MQLRQLVVRIILGVFLLALTKAIYVLAEANGYPLAKWIADTIQISNSHATIELLIVVVFTGAMWWLMDRFYYQLPLSRLPNYKATNVDEFTLHDAACYWADEAPNVPRSRKAERAFVMLSDAIFAGELRMKWHEQMIQQSDGIKANPRWTLEKGHLLVFAIEKGKRPPFLFPEEQP